jgi:hypothetical protein
MVALVDPRLRGNDGLLKPLLSNMQFKQFMRGIPFVGWAITFAALCSSRQSYALSLVATKAWGC